MQICTRLLASGVAHGQTLAAIAKLKVELPAATFIQSYFRGVTARKEYERRLAVRSEARTQRGRASPRSKSRPPRPPGALTLATACLLPQVLMETLIPKAEQLQRWWRVVLGEKILRKLPELLNGGGQVLACVNDPDIGADFLIQGMAAEAPQLRFEQRLENPPEFPDISPESGLKALLFSA